MIFLHQIDPVAVSLGPLRVHWYGLMYLLGFLLAWWLGRRRIRAGRLPGVDEDGFGDLLFYGLIGAIDALPDPCPATFEGSYWSYWYATPGGEWQSYLEGSDTAVPAPGAVEGWRYSDGSAGPGIVPPGATDEATVGETDEATEEESEESAEATEEVTAVTTDPVEPAGDVTPLVVAGIGVVALAGLAGVLLVRRRRALHQD